jgi:hypothetical protein
MKRFRLLTEGISVPVFLGIRRIWICRRLMFCFWTGETIREWQRDLDSQSQGYGLVRLHEVWVRRFLLRLRISCEGGNSETFIDLERRFGGPLRWIQT